jgi:hypothetical protein
MSACIEGVTGSDPARGGNVYPQCRTVTAVLSIITSWLRLWDATTQV